MAFIVLPGGFGTLDEFSEALTLIQTGKLYKFPVILMGKDFWTPFVKWLEETLIPNETIGQEDLKLFTLTDDPSEALNKVLEASSLLNVTPKALQEFKLSQS
jgi:uncharacterized protein (TIGR00730 family)